MNTLKTLTITLPLISLILISMGSLTGCATSGSNGSSVLPQGGPSMSQIYNHQDEFGSSSGQLDQVRSQVPNTHYALGQATHDQSSDVPRMLPNPLISIYVYPHFDGDSQDYVPGHKAYTKLYKETHFALPGEPTAVEQ